MQVRTGEPDLGWDIQVGGFVRLRGGVNGKSIFTLAKPSLECRRRDGAVEGANNF